jgi:putative nucleotidyltransferase with HDIG domain
MNNLQKHHVASGSYYVSRNRPLILQAFLGTCVGVALYDEEAGVGGLVHLLLPEPVSEGSSFQPEKYASTGFPIFLRALYDEGASKKRLKAFIAGGALVGPVVSRDLHLDIGGRTFEIVMRYLKEEKIQIEKSETGGFFTCCLNLNIHNWQCNIEPLGRDKVSNEAGSYVPSVHEIEQVIEGIQPIPQVVLKILRLINEEEHDIKELTEEIRQDQVICAKTLKFCNSAIFAGKNKIDSLDHALAFLGFKNIVKLIISTSMGNFYGHSGTGYSLCKGGLYHHAVGTAIISETLANLTAKVKPGLAYTAGLLHDIGKVVLDQYVASSYPLFYRQLFEEETNFSEAEKTILGVDHAEVGGDLALRWALPDSLIDTIRHHHKPENAVRNLELTHIVYLADLLMSRFHTGLELERLSTETLSSRLRTIGFSIEKFSDIVDLIPVGVFQSEPELALTQS